jgi:hypothetical protein
LDGAFEVEMEFGSWGGEDFGREIGHREMLARAGGKCGGKID